jgi:hypothetical protein
MNRLAQQAILVGLVRRLWQRGSWAGETHVQKAAYLLRELRQVPLDFGFLLYKHGPFSFELRDELAAMQADRLMERQPQRPPYGPRIAVLDRGAQLEERFERTMRRYGEDLDWIADRLGDRGVQDLERLATALWVTQEHPGAGTHERARRLTDVKPHISDAAAVEAVDEIDGLLRAA